MLETFKFSPNEAKRKIHCILNVFAIVAQPRKHPLSPAPCEQEHLAWLALQKQKDNNKTMRDTEKTEISISEQ